jgi:uncharacterized protein YggE
MQTRPFVLTFALFAFFANALFCEDFDNIPKMVVRGEGSLLKPADQVEVTLGVYTQAESSHEALNQNNQQMHQIIANLQALGLNESDYQTGRFSIKPIYSKNDKNEEDRYKVKNYEVVNSIAIKTLKISLIDRILSEAVKAGANQVKSVNFNTNNPQEFEKEAIAIATQKAMNDAHSLAEAAGVRLVRILSLSLDHWQNRPTPRYKMAASSEDIPTPIESGNVEIQAAVNITFEIAQSKSSGL